MDCDSVVNFEWESGHKTNPGEQDRVTAASKTVSDVIHLAFWHAHAGREAVWLKACLTTTLSPDWGASPRLRRTPAYRRPRSYVMVQKLGFKGYPDFQAHLHQEVEATISNPIAKHRLMGIQRAGHAYSEPVCRCDHGQPAPDARARLDTATFDSVASLLSDRKRGLYFVGGRITGALAEYFFTHMQVIRPSTALLSSNSEQLAAIRSQHESRRPPGDIRYPPLRAGNG